MDVVFITTTSEKLDSVPVVDGQIIALSDVDAYLYDQGGVRRAASQHNVVETLPSIGIQGSTYIVTKGDDTHPSGMYVWANDNWIDVLRLHSDIYWVDLGDLSDQLVDEVVSTADTGWYRYSAARLTVDFDKIFSEVEKNQYIVARFDYGLQSVFVPLFFNDTPNSSSRAGVSSRELNGQIEMDVALDKLYLGSKEIIRVAISENGLDDNNHNCMVYVASASLYYLVKSGNKSLTYDDDLKTTDKTIIGAINELNDKKEVMYVNATLADEQGNVTLNKTYDEMVAHVNAGGTVIAKVSTEDAASLCTEPMNTQLSVGEESLSLGDVLYIPLLSAENDEDGLTALYFNHLLRARYRIGSNEAELEDTGGSVNMSVTVTVTSSISLLSVYYTEEYDPDTYVEQVENTNLNTTNKTVIGAINELDGNAKKRIYIGDKIYEENTFTSNGYVIAKLDVSELPLDEYGYIDGTQFNWSDVEMVWNEDSTAADEFYMPPYVLKFTGMTDRGAFLEDLRKGIVCETFVGFSPRNEQTSSSYFEDDIQDIDFNMMAVQLSTSYDIDSARLEYEAYIRVVNILSSSYEYPSLLTSNKKIIEAINEVSEKATAAATSSNSLVIPITATVPAEGNKYILDNCTFTVDSTYTSKFIDDRMRETTEVYVKVTFSDTFGEYTILPLSQNMTTNRGLPNTPVAAGGSAFSMGPVLYFDKTLSDEGDHLGLSIALTLSEEDPTSVPSVYATTFDVHEKLEEIWDDSYMSDLFDKPDFATSDIEATGFINSRTHYIKYSTPVNKVNKVTAVDTQTVGNGSSIALMLNSTADFIEVGKTYKITIDAFDRSFELYGKGAKGTDTTFNGYNVIGCTSVEALAETEQYGERLFTMWKDSNDGLCIAGCLIADRGSLISNLANYQDVETITVSVDEVTETVVPLDSKFLPEDEIKNWAKDVVNSMIVELTQAEYDKLTEAEKNNGTLYLITDEVSTETAVVDIIKDTVIPVSQDEYDALTEDQKKEKVYIVTGISSSSEIDENAVRTIVSDMRVQLTKAEYDALTDEEKNNGNIYMVTDDDESSSTSAPQIYSKAFTFGTDGSAGYSAISNVANGWLTDPGFMCDVSNMTPGLYYLDVDYWVKATSYDDKHGQVLAQIQLGSDASDAQSLFGNTQFGDFGDEDTGSVEGVGKLSGYANYTSGTFDMSVNDMNLSIGSNARADHDIADSKFYMIMRVTARRVGDVAKKILTDD